MSRFLLVLFFTLFAIAGNSQNFEPCKTVEYVDYLEEQYPGIRRHIDDAYHKSIEATKTNDRVHGKVFPIDTTYVIEVVFHVVWRTPDQNIDDIHIHEQVAVLNECFNRQNADTINTRDIFKPVAGNARIRFELAKFDTLGNPTNGITRRQTSVVTFNTINRAASFDYVKEYSRGGVESWNTKKYLNVWVCNLDNTNGQLGLFGYAFPPTGAEFWKNPATFTTNKKQGVVLHYEIVGPNNPAGLDPNIYTNEKTAVHEFGHYLGLRHVWGDGQTNGCSVDDYIEDTPNSISASRGCPKNANTCNTDNLPDQVENYMDYGSDMCSNMFTKQQVDVMRYNLVNLRSGLSSSQVKYLPIPDRIEMSLYPNPVSGSLKFFSEEIFDEDITLTFSNYIGQKVYEVTRRKTAYILEFDNIGIANGCYYVSMTIGDRIIPYYYPFVFVKD